MQRPTAPEVSSCWSLIKPAGRVRTRKLEIRSIRDAQLSSDRHLVRVQAGPRSEAILALSREAERDLLYRLLARVHDDRAGVGTEHLQIQAKDVDRFLPPLGGVGLRFYLDNRTALHVVLPWSLARSLARMIETFQDEAAWREAGPDRRASKVTE